MRTENSKIFGGVTGRGKDRQRERKQRKLRPHLFKMKHPRLDFASFNTMVAEC